MKMIMPKERFVQTANLLASGILATPKFLVKLKTEPAEAAKWGGKKYEH